MGTCCEARENSPKHVDEYHEALKVKPDDAGARARLYYLALTLEQQGKLAEAEAGYRDLLRLQPKNWEAHHQLELLLKKQGQQRRPRPI